MRWVKNRGHPPLPPPPPGDQGPARVQGRPQRAAAARQHAARCFHARPAAAVRPPPPLTRPQKAAEHRNGGKAGLCGPARRR